MGRVSARGIEIAYEEKGTGEPAVVLIHAPFGSRWHMAPLFDHLAARRRVIAIDVRGTGASQAPGPEGFRVADIAEDAIAVCRAAGVQRAVFCGHSLGGSATVELASRAPDLVAGVALLDAAVLFPESLRRQVLESVVPALAGPQWLDVLRGYMGARMFGPFDPPEVRARALGDVAALPPHMAAPLMRDGMSQDFSEQLAAGRYPLLFVHATVPADLQRLRELRPDAIVASVAGSGHFVTLVVPDQVNAMLDRFIAILPQAVMAA